MKRVTCLVAALLLLAAVGCKDENHPKITRISVSESCGVAPLNVEVFGAASGGDESGGPTGGVNNLEYVWDFGDGGGTTSVSYYTYETSGEYTITLSVKDGDGKNDVSAVTVSVIEDSLKVTPATVPESGYAVGTPVMLSYLANTCSIDPLNNDDYVKLNQTWTITQVAPPPVPPATAPVWTYKSRNPLHTFAAAGTYDVELEVYYAEWDVLRHASLPSIVVP